jgi:hypothetical protein
MSAPAALQAASDWAFDRPTPEQSTISLLVVYKGDIVHERYADGFDMTYADANLVYCQEYRLYPHRYAGR